MSNNAPSFATRSRISKLVVLGSVYAYLYATCPDEESFDAKNEIIRVVTFGRPPPKSVERVMKKLESNTRMKMAMDLTHEVHMQSLAGAAILATVHIPMLRKDYHWIGVNNRWIYLPSSWSRWLEERDIGKKG